MSDFNAKMHQIRFWLAPCPAGRTYSAPSPLAGVEGDWLHSPDCSYKAHNVVKQRNTFLLGYTVPQKCTLVRLSAEF